MQLALLVLLVLPTANSAWIRFAGGPRAITSVGDVDGDGRDDFAVVEGGMWDDGSRDAWLLSGREGRMLFRIRGAEPNEHAGSVALSSDLDGDGHRDLAVSAFVEPDGTRRIASNAGPGRVRIHSTHGGALLRTLESPRSKPGDRFGYELADAGDVDGDGVNELLVGAPGIGRAFVFAPGKRKLVREIVPHADGGEFGFAVCGASDLDGDGTIDFVVGDPGWEHRGFVEIVSGKDGSRLRVHEGHRVDSAYWSRFGCTLAVLPDVSGKALLVGVDGEDFGFVRAFTGTTNTTVFELAGTSEDWGRFGTSIAVGGDLDGDGCSDFVVGDASSSMDGDFSRGQACGAVSIFSGKTHKLLRKLYGDKEHDCLGFSVGFVRDLDGDGVDDLVAKSNRYFRVYSGKKARRLYTVMRPDGVGIPASEGGVPASK